jgi:hypothetical protein
MNKLKQYDLTRKSVQAFNLKQLIQVRSNFDEYFARKYEKKLKGKAKSYVEGKADELYLKEPGGKRSINFQRRGRSSFLICGISSSD